MLDQFNDFIKEQELCTFGEQILLAVSGGIDSVVMTHLFSQSDYTCAIAHCNFQLRVEESNEDEAFVSSMAASLEMQFHVKRFNVDQEVSNKGISVQMAARELRYAWFEELIHLQSYDSVATAHNRNDSVETFFLNLSRGTGIRGLAGIPYRNGNIIRPLLFASREDIAGYARRNNLIFREDSTNIETKYQRNKIRHDIVPVMEQINPGFVDTMAGNMARLREVHSICMQSIDNARKALFDQDSDSIHIDIAALKRLSPIRTWLYELFSPFGFTRSQCEGIEKIMDADPGRQSISTTHQLYKDRARLILVESTRKTFDRYYLDNPDNLSSLPFPMDVEVLDRSELQRIPDDKHIACLDHAEIQFPLTIRHWLHGDYFFPLGMNQIKKLSDFFVDEKIPVPEKERAWILASGNKIVWIMGHRIDNRFRITSKTTRVLLLRFQSDVASQHLKESL